MKIKRELRRLLAFWLSVILILSTCIPVTAEEQGDSEVGIETESKMEMIYTLRLTHCFRFSVDDESRNIETEETLELAEWDFEEGICDLSRFAYDAPQLVVAAAEVFTTENFDENHEGVARIVYSVREGWKMLPVDEAKSEGIVLRDIFQGELTEYEFVPADVVRIHARYKYSDTGGLPGIDAVSPEIIEIVPERNAVGDYELEFALPTVDGFRIVLNPAPLNYYLVKAPTGNETPEQLEQMWQDGSFSGDVANRYIYEYQVQNGRLADPDYTIYSIYGNRYSVEYNQAWNEARIKRDDAYTAMAVCGNPHDSGVEDHGANALENPKLRVSLTSEQLREALEKGLNITVSYRRIATWYTVNHWVPVGLSGLSAEQLIDAEQWSVGEVTYVLLDTEKEQGRVGGLTRAQAKTGGVYDLLVPLGFSQKLIRKPDEMNEDNSSGTTVDIYYKAADAYQVIFDTDHTYIPRQWIELGSGVNFAKVGTPTRKGYTFGGWQYLKKDAVPNEHGEYAADDYIQVEKEGTGQYTLMITNEVIMSAKLQETDGVPMLHLYPVWIPAMTQVTVILWTEDLTGKDDVQASAAGGNTGYYDDKYRDYGTAPVTHLPGTENASYSNVRGFTIENMTTDLSLTQGGKLLDVIQDRIAAEFAETVGKTGNIDNSLFYTQSSFQILRKTDNGTVEASTASADGNTVIYVYYTRNVYTLKFHYFGTAYNSNATLLNPDNAGNYDCCVAISTDGFSYGGAERVVRDNELIFDYQQTINGKRNAYSRHGNTKGFSESNMCVPRSITITAKYGADLRDVWPVARAEEQSGEMKALDALSYVSADETARMVSWATTDGKYRDDAVNGISHSNEATIMGLYTTMDGEVIADPGNVDTTHHLVAFWATVDVSHYRYNYCYELPGLDVDAAGVIAVSLYNNRADLRNILYLVPADSKYGFDDLMRVSYRNNTVAYDAENGEYYAVRGYDSGSGVQYYAVAERVDVVSTNNIGAQNPSAVLHMTRVKDTADHTSRWRDSDGKTWGNILERQQVGSADSPYDLYFYYERNRYTITYMAPTSRSQDTNAVELGHIKLPYGTYVTKAQYAFQLLYTDTNQQIEGGSPKYRWTYPENVTEPVPVCQDRDPNGTAEWDFTGWSLDPTGMNIQWGMDGASDDFYIAGDLCLYAIWETPILDVTFHFNGGRIGGDAGDTVTVRVPANTTYSSVGTIPHPVRNGYLLENWYISDDQGNPIINDDDSKTPFSFDSVIIDNVHVAAEWTAVTDERYGYTIYYVTKSLRADDTEHTETVRIRNDEIVTEDGEIYYVLARQLVTDQVYVSDLVLNLTAKGIEGYRPIETNKTLTVSEANILYDVIFYYDFQISGSYTVRFVEAGTEMGDSPEIIISSGPIEADQAQVTPSVAQINALSGKGYQLVNKDGAEYVPAEDYGNLTWLDKEGNYRSGVAVLTREDLPATVTYLARTILYTIVYRMADDSPAQAGQALALVTGNPDQYTSRDTFTLYNPGGFYSIADGKYYRFLGWTEERGDGVIRSQLTVEQGTVGNLTFVAHWEEMPTGSLMVTNTVEGKLGNRQKDFYYTVTLSDAGINGTYGDMEFADGAACFCLKHGQKKMAVNLPEGVTYRVVQREEDGYDLTYTGEGGSIMGGRTAEAAFINTREGIVDTGIHEGVGVSGLFLALGGVCVYIVCGRRRRRR